MEVKGRIKLIEDTKTYGNNGFRKREMVITTEEQYPQHILIEFVQDKCDLLNDYQLGQQVVVSINLRGRECVNTQSETKYYNSVQEWIIEYVQQHDAQYTLPHVLPSDDFEPASNFNEEDHDDLPF